MFSGADSSNQIQYVKREARGRTWSAFGIVRVFLECSQMIPDVSASSPIPPISLANPTPLPHQYHPPQPHVSDSEKKKTVFPFIHITFSIIFLMIPLHLNIDVTSLEITSWFFPWLISSTQIIQLDLDIKQHKTGRQCRLWPQRYQRHFFRKEVALYSACLDL